MAFESKVVWSEGMFLNPQHFQQQERYLERLVNGKCDVFGAYNWGVSELEIDQELLKLGKFSVVLSKGVFPDGTPFSIPEQNLAPAVIDVPEGLHDVTVLLGVPVRRPGAVDVTQDELSQSYARHGSKEFAVRDVSLESGDSVKINIAELRFKLLLESDDLSGYVTIPIAKIAESRSDKNILLEETFVPTCVDMNVSPVLSGFLTELVGLLNQRAESIADRLADPQKGGVAQVADYMMLQMLNRFTPLAAHLQKIRSVHPLTLYSELVQFAGELATFVAQTKLPPKFDEYLHSDILSSFSPVFNNLRQGLSVVYEQSAISLPLAKSKHGIYISKIENRSLLSGAEFVISADSDHSEDMLRKQLPAQSKIGPIERISQLVNAAMPGIQLKPLSVVPRELPYRSGYCYFELDKSSQFWKELQSSGAIAIHLGGDFPGIRLELWAIKSK